MSFDYSREEQGLDTGMASIAYEEQSIDHSEEGETEVQSDYEWNDFGEKGLSSEESRKLFIWNFCLGLLHLASGIVVIFITDTSATTPIYTFFPNPDTDVLSDTWEPTPNKIYDVPVGWFSAATLLVAAINHLLVASFGRYYYEKYLNYNRNPFRWFEYAISASIMHVMIAQLVGVFSINLLFSIFGFSLMSMIFGNEQEILNSSRDRNDNEPVQWRPFCLGWIPHIFGWVSILSFFFVFEARDGETPIFVWAVILLVFSFDLAFRIITFKQQRAKNSFYRFSQGELWFCALSLISKQALAWVNYAGTAAFLGKSA